jgi:hypothetical protein
LGIANLASSAALGAMDLSGKKKKARDIDAMSRRLYG